MNDLDSKQNVERVDTVPPLPRGDTNENPRGIGFLALIAEDFRTHGSDPMEPGFWAVAVHRFGNWRMGLKPKPLRAPVTVVYRTLRTCVHWGWGIKLDYTVKLGRRVRIWHHGGMVLGARSIGDDVHIRQNTTFGIPRRTELSSKPMIGDRVDIGCGAVVLGNIHIGADSVIGANSVVTRDVPASTLVVGNPARIVRNLDESVAPAGMLRAADGGTTFPPEATSGVIAADGGKSQTTQTTQTTQAVPNDPAAPWPEAKSSGPWRARA